MAKRQPAPTLTPVSMPDPQPQLEVPKVPEPKMEETKTETKPTPDPYAGIPYGDAFRALGQMPQELSEKDQKRIKSAKVIAGLTDGLNALSNIYFAHKGADIQPQKPLLDTVSETEQRWRDQIQNNRDRWLSRYAQISRMRDEDEHRRNQIALKQEEMARRQYNADRKHNLDLAGLGLKKQGAEFDQWYKGEGLKHKMNHDEQMRKIAQQRNAIGWTNASTRQKALELQGQREERLRNSSGSKAKGKVPIRFSDLKTGRVYEMPQGVPVDYIVSSLLPYTFRDEEDRKTFNLDLNMANGDDDRLRMIYERINNALQQDNSSVRGAITRLDQMAKSGSYASPMQEEDEAEEDVEDIDNSDLFD